MRRANKILYFAYAADSLLAAISSITHVAQPRSPHAGKLAGDSSALSIAK